MVEKPDLTLVQKIFDKNPDIGNIELIEQIINSPVLDPMDMWLLPQYPFNKWRRKFDYPNLLKSIKSNQQDFSQWMSDQDITDEYLLNGYFSDFFQNKPDAKDKKLFLIKHSYNGEEELRVWHSYDGKTSLETGEGTVHYEFIKDFISYYDWLTQKGKRFNFSETFFNTNPNTEHEQVYLNMNTRLLKMGGMHPPMNGAGMLVRGKKLEFVNITGLDLYGHIFFGSFGRLELFNCSVDNMKCNDLNIPGLIIVNSSVRNLQIRNSTIDHWQFIGCNTTGNFIDSKLSFIRIFGGQFTPTFTNSEISDIFINHADYPHQDDFEKTYRVLAKCAKESGDETLSQRFKIAEFDFIKERTTGIRKLLMGLDKIYWGYGQQPKRLIYVMIGSILFFGVLYSFFPNNFSSTTQGMKNQSYFVRLFNSIYYSVVTFTTLGYGDISPIGGLKIVAAFEAIFGATTLGFLVAGLSRKD